MGSLKKRLKAGELTIGSWITIANLSVAEIMAKAGFDWLTVDMEHSAITLSEAQKLIQTIELSGVVPLVRVGENNPNLIKRVMDMGSHGVIVPMVNSKEDAIKAFSAVKYPLLGIRGVGLARAQGYGFDFERYRNWVNKESVVIIQIEHIEAVNNLEDILSVEGIDAFIIGPYDLSGSLGRLGDFDCPQMLSALKRIKEVSKSFKIPMGFHVVQPDVAAALRKIEEGYKFLAFSLDSMFLGRLCRDSLKQIRKK